MKIPIVESVNTGIADEAVTRSDIGIENRFAPGGITMVWSRLLWYAIYAFAFGFVEAAVVVYLRRLMGMPVGLDYRAILAQRHLALTGANLTDVLRNAHLLEPELIREAATLVLLLGAAFGAGRNRRESWALFFYTFALWDLSYYLYLAVWIGFPKSLFEIDLYYMIPIAWYGPVWFPVLIVMPALLFGSLRVLRNGPQAQP